MKYLNDRIVFVKKLRFLFFVNCLINRSPTIKVLRLLYCSLTFLELTNIYKQNFIQKIFTFYSSQQETRQTERNEEVLVESTESMGQSKTSEVEQTPSADGLARTTSYVSTSISTLQLLQRTLGNKFNKLSNSDNEKITNAISYFIAVDCEPYSAVGRKGFRHLMSVVAPTYSIPSRNTFRSEKFRN